MDELNRLFLETMWAYQEFVELLDEMELFLLGLPPTGAGPTTALMGGQPDG